MDWISFVKDNEGNPLIGARRFGQLRLLDEVLMAHNANTSTLAKWVLETNTELKRKEDLY